MQYLPRRPTLGYVVGLGKQGSIVDLIIVAV